MGRRANDEGSTYRRKDGRWEAAAYFATTSGIRKRKRFYGITRTEAHSKLLAAKAQAAQGIRMPERTWKLGDYLDYWLREIVQPVLRPTTYERYASVVRLHLKPGLGAQPLPDLTVPLLQTFLNEQQGIGQSIRSVHIMRQVLSSALTQACREELLGRNVARFVKLPPYRGRQVHPWTMDETRQFLLAAQPDRLFPVLALLLLYGLRRGEVLGLRWRDIDFHASVIHIRQQLQRVGGALRIGSVKTEAGERDLPLVNFARQVLVAQQAHQQQVGLPSGHGMEQSSDGADLVFTTSSGLPVEPRNLVRSFQRIREQHGLRFIRLHDLRHTTATLLKNLHVPDKDIQLILGHSDVSVTQRFYEHGDLDGQRAGLVQAEAVLLDAGTVVHAGTHSTRASQRRCRQNLPSKPNIVDQITSSISGSGGWTRTTDPRLMSPVL